MGNVTDKLTAEQATQMITDKAYGDNYSNLFYKQWKQLYPKCEDQSTDFGYVFIVDKDIKFCLVNLQMLYVLDHNKSYKLKLTPKQYHTIIMKRRFY